MQTNLSCATSPTDTTETSAKTTEAHATEAAAHPGDAPQIVAVGRRREIGAEVQHTAATE
ncbi:hypothetical protein IV102_30100 [bacterium]|nr:hypothetical protein [bacterium]